VHVEESGGRGHSGGSGVEQSGVRGWCFNGSGVLHNGPPYEEMGL
jgi:hypothetical protein